MKEHMWGKGRVGRVAGVATCGALFAACALAEGAPEGESGGASPAGSPASELVDDLDSGGALAVRGSENSNPGSLVQVEASSSGDDFSPQSFEDLELTVLGGHIDARTTDEDGVVAIRDLAIEIDDVELPGDVVPKDVVFGEIRAALPHPQTVAMSWSEGGERAEARASLDFEVDWSVSVEGGDFHPLAPVQIEELDIVLELYRESGTVHAELAGFREGVFYEWGGMVELGGLSLDLRAEEAL